MEGGYVIKLAGTVAALDAAFRDAISAERFRLQRVGDPKNAWGLYFGVSAAKGEAYLLPHLIVPDEMLAALGSAIADRTKRPVLLAVDSDEGASRIRSWNGGSKLSPETGWMSWQQSHVETRYKLVPPPFTRLPRDRERTVLAAWNKRLPAPLVDVKGRVTGVAQRLHTGPLSALLPEWQITVDIAGHAVRAELPAMPERALVQRGGRLLLTALTEAMPKKLANKRMPVQRDRKADVVKRLRTLAPDATVTQLERVGPGFGPYDFKATVRCQGHTAKLDAVAKSDGARDIARGVANAIESFRDAIRQYEVQKVDWTFDQLLARGDLDGAVGAYRTLHAGYYAAMSEDEAFAAARAKVLDLARLNGITMR